MEVKTRSEGPSDQDLADRASIGDREAFSMLVERHYMFIHRVAWKWCRDRSAAEDIAQNVCLRLGVAIRNWRNESAFKTWLYRITINAAHDHARFVAREMRKAQAMAVHAAALGEEIETYRPSHSDYVWDAVRTLPDKQRDAMLLVYGEELNHADAAAVMGCAESTVSYHLHAARKQLKSLLGKSGAEQ
ncbi:RNA polymerase sigma factor [Hoeflea sp.]|uniref:RNA polymerase sigma factor n=1 Tax=Hoeflea sp. TaxID=1940281 RepID=UPI003B5188A3